MPGNVTTAYNPIVDPGYHEEMQKWSDINKEKVAQDPIKGGKKQEKQDCKPVNDSSPNNPFNTMDNLNYERWKVVNDRFYKQFEVNRTREAGEATEGNWTSDDNPFYFEPRGLNEYRYGPYQPRFPVPKKADFAEDRRNMENVSRDYLGSVYGVDFSKSKMPPERF